MNRQTGASPRASGLRLLCVLLCIALLTGLLSGFVYVQSDVGVAAPLKAAAARLSAGTTTESDRVLGQGTIAVSAESFYVQTPGDAALETFEGRPAVRVEAGDSLCFDVEAPAAGAYRLQLTYFLPSEALMTTRVSLSINGESVESSMRLPSKWANNVNYTTDEYGNELYSMPDRVYEWLTHTLNNRLYQYQGGLYFNLQAGTNHIELTVTETEVYLAQAVFYGEDDTPTYEEWAAGQPETPAVDGEPQQVTVEGEKYTYQNRAQIHPDKSRDANLEPFDPAVNRVNSLAPTSWGDVGDAVTWQITVPQDGYYAIVFKFRQSEKDDIASYRHIYIDGEVPFSEFYNYAFAYTGSRNQNETLSVGGETVYFYFTAGTHEITLETTAEVFADADARVRQLVSDMNALAMDIRAVTGGQSDEDRDWHIDQYLPSLPADLAALQTQMEELYGIISALNGSETVLSTLSAAYQTVQGYLEDKDGLERLVNNLGSFAQATGSLAESVSQISEKLLPQPLTIDRLYVTQAPDDVPKANIGFFTSLGREIQKLFLSFTVKSSATQEVRDDCLNVWVLGSAPQVEVLKQLVAEKYEDGEVFISILQDEQKLLLAIATGEAPDVVIGGSRTKPYDFGLRDAVYDLTQFADFKEYASQFNPEYFVPFIQGDAVYALPQTVNFFVTFYRQDILDSLGLDVPETWDDLIADLPTLYRRGMNVNLPIANAASVKPLTFTMPYLFQYDGSLYAQDGLQLSLGDPQTMQAFTMMTDLFTKYSAPVTVSNFYVSFRNGTVPLGISDVGTYLLLTQAAMEIDGLWGLAPGIGTRQADGSVNHDYTAVASPCYILKNTRDPERSWEFLKWWMSTDTQLRYSETLVATYGQSYLWLSANLEALSGISSLPADHKEVILDQLNNVQEIPSHPASSLVERSLSNAWASVVLSGMDTRTALDKAVIEESRDIARKLREFGFIDEHGNVLKPLALATSEKARELTGVSAP